MDFLPARRLAVDMSGHAQTAYVNPERPLLTVNDVALALVVSRDSVYRLIRNGELTPVRVGTRLRFQPDDLRDYLERGRAGP